MDRGFFPGGGFGGGGFPGGGFGGGGFGGGFGGGGFGRPFFRPFPHPFFPNRFLFPFFFFSPFFFPFFRDGVSDDMLYAQHQVQAGDTLASVGHKYNIPHSILEEANSHLANPNQLNPGETVYVPRISNMGCQKTYSEMTSPVQQGQQGQHGQHGQHMKYQGQRV